MSNKNTSIGLKSLSNVTTGSNNIAIGASALFGDLIINWKDITKVYNGKQTEMGCFYLSDSGPVIYLYRNKEWFEGSVGPVSGWGVRFYRCDVLVSAVLNITFNVSA